MPAAIISTGLVHDVTPSTAPSTVSLPTHEFEDKSKETTIAIESGHTTITEGSASDGLSPKKAQPAPEKNSIYLPSNIEDVPVVNDPRKWSQRRKLVVLVIIAYTALAPTTGAFIYQPAITDVERDLRATTNEIALSLSLFVLVQGNFPLIWFAISEIKGRKFVYIFSMIIFTTGSAVGGVSKSIAVLICMRMLQAAGSSAALVIGAGNLADIYSPKERGTMMGIYYAAPLLGPSLGPLLGGAVTSVWNWRATFFLLTILGGIALCSFFFFPETFRRERSLTYQAAKEHAIERARWKAEQKAAKQTSDPEKNDAPVVLDPLTVNVTLLDVNPLKPIWSTLKRKNNLFILFPSSLLFAFQYSICFTTSRTFSAAPYNFDPLQVGLVLLSFGLGNMFGSVLGGKWSDYNLAKFKRQNGGKGAPEMRLQSTKLVMPIIPLAVVAFAWITHEKLHWAGAVTTLFVSGFGVLFVYASTLAYIVDANAGRSTAAVAANSAFRGITGLVASEIAAPLQDTIGDGGLYSLWASLLVLTELMILLVIWRGQRWREGAEKRERMHLGL